MRYTVDNSVSESMIVHDNLKKYENVQSNLIFGSEGRNNHTYSIVIPTFKRAETLRDTLQSCLGQKGDHDYNIIIVDNNPDRGDATEQLIEKLSDPRVKYYKNASNIGMTGNWNRCLELCEGEYAVLLHDDDLLSPDYLSNISNIIAKHPETDLLYVKLKLWEQYRNMPVPDIEGNDKPHPLFKASLINCFITYNHTPTGVAIKRDSFLRIGGFDERYYPCADYYFYCYATLNGLNVYNYTKPLAIYRLLINESQNEETQLGFVVRPYHLIVWLLDKLKLPKVIKRRLLSIRINYILINSEPSTVRKAALQGIKTSKILLLKKGFIRKIYYTYSNKRMTIIRKYIYRPSAAVDCL